ncbi:MAG: acyl-CoA dehydrogenase [Chloroflexi bacterium]|nr:acyl-CoA dehydrogenase [Chloroflexota bacterium]
MNFTLSESDLLLRRTIRDFAVKELEPTARERDAKEEFSWPLYKKLGKLGVTGLGIAPERGGSGGLLQTAIAVEEIARSDASMALSLLASLSLASHGIEHHANDALRNHCLPPIARGETIASFAFTEPEAGSDAANIQTTAIKKNGKYLVNGSKTFITNGDIADTFLLFATTDRAKRHKGMLAMVVERGSKGLSSRKQTEKMGMRASSTAEVLFDDVEVPAGNLVGGEGEGFKIAMQIVDGSRPIIGAQAAGIAQGALDLAVRHVRRRKQFGQAVADFQGVQWMLADMVTQIDAARLLVYRAAFLRDQGLPCTKESAMAKLFASEAAMQVATQALQLHGGSGYFKASPIERAFRDAKVTEIYEGTSQIQRLVIARRLLAEASSHR